VLQRRIIEKEAGNYVADAVLEATPLLRALPRCSTHDNDELELQGGRVYLHLGARRDEPPRR
jgi:hypothetical protein